MDQTLNAGPAGHARQLLAFPRAVWTAAVVVVAACGAPTAPAPLGTGTGLGGTGAIVAPPIAGAANGGTVAAVGGRLSPPPVAGIAGASGSPAPVSTASEPLPCDVGKVVAAKCQNCHGVQLIGGAPMPLVKPSDFTAQFTSLKTLPGQKAAVSQLVKMRINDAAKPMPPSGLLPETERSLLAAWLDSGAPHGTAADAACVPATPTKPTGELPPVTTGDVPVNPDGTRCYTFRNHGQPMPGDTTPYKVPISEHYVSFYYNAPWQEPSELVRWRTIYDNQKVLHHWLLYSTLGNAMDGAFAPSIGTHLGDAAQLIAGWAVGGNDVQMPKDVGLRMPKPGEGLMLEYHYYNSGIVEEMDSTALELCVVPTGTMKHTAGMTWLGTENFNGPAGMPARVASSFSGTCAPSRIGAGPTDPIHVFQLWPHMHTYGRNMKSVINRANGTREEIFNKPFNFDYQITYPSDFDLMPGDTITSTCDFMNTSNLSVAFGPSTNQEMCYQFAFSYPAGALENGVPSLVGASNTCW